MFVGLLAQVVTPCDGPDNRSSLWNVRALFWWRGRLERVTARPEISAQSFTSNLMLNAIVMDLHIGDINDVLNVPRC